MNKTTNEKESKCYASCSDCYHANRESFFACKEIDISVKRRILKGD